MKTYPSKKLGDVLKKIVGGGTPSKSNPGYWDGDIPWASVKDVKEGESTLKKTEDSITEAGLKNSAANLIPAGSIIISTRMGLGRVVKTEIDTTINQDLKALFPCKDLDADYLLLFLRSKAQELVEKGSGATVSGIKLDVLKNLEIPVPSIEEQRKIVARIEEQFAKIDEVARLRAESVAATAQLLSAALHEIFEGGERQGWKHMAIGEIASVGPVKSEIRELPDKTPISFIPMASVNEFSQSIEKQEEKKLGEVRKGYTYFRRGDVIVAKVTPCMENGKIAIADNLNTDIGFGSSEFHVIRAKTEMLVPKYLYQILRQIDFRRRAEEKMTGTSGLKRVPKEFIKNYKIPFPPLAEQKKIVKKLDALSEKVRALQECQSAQVAGLKALKQSILYQAFSSGVE